MAKAKRAPKSSLSKPAFKRSAKPTSKPSSAITHPFGVNPKAIASARAEYAKLLLIMANARREESAGLDRYWEAVGTILAKRLFILDDQTPTATKWITQHTDETERNAHRLIRIAQAASPNDEAKYGLTKIDLALTYRAQQPGYKPSAKPNAPEPSMDFGALRFTVKRDAKPSKLTLETITTDELRAIVFKHDGSPAKPARLGPTGTAIVTALSAYNLEEIAVKEHDAQLTIGPFRADQTSAIADALNHVELPKRGEKKSETSVKKGAGSKADKKSKAKTKPKPARRS